MKNMDESEPGQSKEPHKPCSKGQCQSSFAVGLELAKVTRSTRLRDARWTSKALRPDAFVLCGLSRGGLRESVEAAVMCMEVRLELLFGSW